MNYPRKNWVSVAIFNCEHPAWQSVEATGFSLLELKFLPDELIGELPDEWNRLVDENQSVDGAKMMHWTAGVPAIDHYRDAPGAGSWHVARRQMEIVG